MRIMVLGLCGWWGVALVFAWSLCLAAKRPLPRRTGRSALPHIIHPWRPLRWQMTEGSWLLV